MANVKHSDLEALDLHIPKAHTAASHSDQSGTGAEVDSAISLKHARQHGVNSTDDHSAMVGTVGNLIKISADGLFEDAGSPFPSFPTYFVLVIPCGGRSPDVDDVIFNGHYFLEDITIVKTGIHGEPPGSNLTIDILKDDMEQSVLSTLSAGASDEETDITDTDILTTNKFGLKVKSVGSPDPGTINSVMIFYKLKT